MGERLTKRYLRQIALGLQHLHFHRKSHNRITPKAILYDKQGSFFINMLRSASVARSKEELTANRETFYFAPEFLLQRLSRSPKNDIWALGCLALHMITGLPPECSAFHPYNFALFRSER